MRWRRMSRQTIVASRNNNISLKDHGSMVRPVQYDRPGGILIGIYRNIAPHAKAMGSVIIRTRTEAVERYV